jgi:hypothetical protein
MLLPRGRLDSGRCRGWMHRATLLEQDFVLSLEFSVDSSILRRPLGRGRSQAQICNEGLGDHSEVDPVYPGKEGVSDG